MLQLNFFLILIVFNFNVTRTFVCRICRRSCQLSVVKISCWIIWHLLFGGFEVRLLCRTCTNPFVVSLGSGTLSVKKRHIFASYVNRMHQVKATQYYKSLLLIFFRILICPPFLLDFLFIYLLCSSFDKFGDSKFQTPDATQWNKAFIYCTNSFGALPISRFQSTVIERPKNWQKFGFMNNNTSTENINRNNN